MICIDFFGKGCKKQTLDRKVLLISPTFSVVNTHNIYMKPLFVLTGPEVVLGAKSVNFMQIDVGDVATRTIDLINNSDIDAIFQVCTINSFL